MIARLLVALGVLVCVGPARAEPSVTVLSYNVNYGRVGRATLDAIAESGADVVFLQETNRRWERAIRQRLRRQYPHMVFRHHRRAGGLAVLSRHPLRENRFIEPGRGGWWPAGRHVVATPIGGLQVLNLHLRPPLSDPTEWLSGYFTTRAFRAREMAWFLPHLDDRLPTLVLGDLNEQGGPASDQLRARGMRDAVAELAPGRATWRWNHRGVQVEQVLDHVYYGPRLAVSAAEVLETGGSDHLPIRVIVTRSPGEVGAQSPEADASPTGG